MGRGEVFGGRSGGAELELEGIFGFLLVGLVVNVGRVVGSRGSGR